ncbi:phage major capsid protein [Pseudomonas luteola]|uniref:phage major capsid protein n=1 Tax=Pseudomonas luteola TaxID=47886 RepID=UPI002897EEF5|nr:phage major capsid protein [Pseudomonas luteola]
MRELALVQYVKSLAVTEGSIPAAIEYAKLNYGITNPAVRLLEKQLVSTGDLNADPDFRSAGRAFVELIRTRSLIGKIAAVSAFRKVPVNTRVLKQSESPVAQWTAQGGLVKVSHTRFDQEFIDSQKITALLVLTNELLRGQGADFESAVSRDLTRPIAELEGRSFIDPTSAGIEGLSPASITYGVTPIASSGTDAEALRLDIKALFDAFEGSLEDAVLVMNPMTAVSLSLMQRTLGQSGLTLNGGDLFGVPTVTSEAVPRDMVALVDPSSILLVDEGISLTVSEQSTLQLEDDADGNAQYLSLWQQNLTGLMASRYLNWKAVREGSVAWLSGVQW